MNEKESDYIFELKKIIEEDNSGSISDFKDKLLNELDSRIPKRSNSEIQKLLELNREKFLEEESFTVGDLVCWKPGLKNRRYPEYDEPAIVMEILNEPIINTEEHPSSPFFKENLNIQIGTIFQETNDFVFIHVDKKRFKHYLV